MRSVRGRARRSSRRDGAADDNAPARPCRGAHDASPAGGASACARLGIDEAAVGAAARAQAGSSARPGIVVERRIEEDHVERARARARGTRARRRHAPRARRAPSIARRRARARDQRAVAIDGDRERRAARQRFERQRAAAGVEIERARARSRSWPSQLNSVSRTRSGVGRKPGDGGKADDAAAPARRR